ncbi:Phosphoribosylformylglycinamidine synthase subunit PurL [bacterium HR39]|nr:Phosphoribosylformylglycinamidine synthase subunit PurL [bacterium HR39]
MGGILRDVFTMGARPVALLDALRFGAPEHPKSRWLVSGVVAGIGGYGNCVGVPTVGGEATFHHRYNGNILVNVMCVGVARRDRIFYARAAGVGNPVVYVGAKTGRDGIHGATMASAAFSEDAESKRPTVQVGDPFTDKLLIEACLELMEHECIVAIQDMGAAGLTSSSFEMAARGGTGIELDLDRVPLREEGMSAYEIMLSESQERMLMVLREGREEEARRIFEKWELDFAVIGRVTDTRRLVVRHRGEVVADIPVAAVADAAPVYERPYEIPPKPLPVVCRDAAVPVTPDEALLRLLASPDLASKRWIFEQYDWGVMADTVAGPAMADAAVVRVHGTQRGLALTTDCTPRYCEADPREGGRQAVAEAYRNLCAVGAMPLAITDCLNFGSPERPHIMGQFVAAVEGMAEACRALDFPVVSGNVSFYNETDGRAILPTPQVGGLGLVEDVARIATLAFDAPDLQLVLVGLGHGWLSCSLFLREILGREEGAPPPVDPALEKRHGAFVREQIRKGRVRACHDLSDGGLAVAAAEMCLASGIGARLSVPMDSDGIFGWLFGEDQGRYLLAMDPKAAAALLRDAREQGVVARIVGRTGGDALILGNARPISLAVLREAHGRFFARWMEDDDGPESDPPCR